MSLSKHSMGEATEYQTSTTISPRPAPFVRSPQAFSFHDAASLSTSSYAPPTPPAIPPLPDMSVFSHKRTFAEMEGTRSQAGAGSPPFKVSPPHSPHSPGFSQPPSPTPSSHDCGPDCRYCATLTNLDIAAFYWSMLAMRGYPEMKAKTTGHYHDAMKIPPPPSPTPSSYEPTSYSKPPSPSGSLSSSYDSEPSSPSSSTTSETPTTKDLGGTGPGVKYQCHICHKAYSHPRLLNRHMQSHTPYKKHHCPRCRKGFNDAFDLKRHIRTHTGIKPFHCSLCEKSFTQRCSLEAHLTRVHNINQKFSFRERRPKLFVCEDCGQTFIDNSQFRVHEKEGCCSATKKKYQQQQQQQQQ